MRANMDEIQDFNQVVSELVRILRGPRSQTAVSRKLGYRTNQLYRWEAGLRSPTWKDFVRLCRAVDAPLEGQLRKSLNYKGDPNDGAAIANHLMQNLPISRVATLTGISRFTLSRWLSKKTEPGLAEMLQLLHCLWNLLFVFLEGWVEVERIPSLAMLHASRSQELDLFYNFPASITVLEALKLESYLKIDEHSDQWLAQKIGLSSDEVSKIIHRLQASRLIESVGLKYKVLKPFAPKNGNFQRYKEVRKFWFNKILEKYSQMEKVPEESLAPAFTFACSQSAMTEIASRYRNFLTEMNTIIAEDTDPANRLVVHSSMLFNLIGETE